MTISHLLLILAAILFVLATFGIPSNPKINLVAAGLAAWVISLLV